MKAAFNTSVIRYLSKNFFFIFIFKDSNSNNELPITTSINKAYSFEINNDNNNLNQAVSSVAVALAADPKHNVSIKTALNQNSQQMISSSTRFSNLAYAEDTEKQVKSDILRSEPTAASTKQKATITKLPLEHQQKIVPKNSVPSHSKAHQRINEKQRSRLDDTSIASSENVYSNENLNYYSPGYGINSSKSNKMKSTIQIIQDGDDIRINIGDMEILTSRNTDKKIISLSPKVMRKAASYQSNSMIRPNKIYPSASVDYKAYLNPRSSTSTIENRCPFQASFINENSLASSNYCYESELGNSVSNSKFFNNKHIFGIFFK